MTFQQIVESNKDFLTPQQASEVLGCKPYSINEQAKIDPAKLGFPVCIMGSNVRIPRLAFVHWMRYGNAAIQIKEEAHEQIQETHDRSGADRAGD